MRISKYEFNSKEQAQEKIDALGTATDENGNEYPTHKSTIVQLGNIVLEKAVYNQEGTEEITAPVLSDKWHLDVAWSDSEITTVEKEAVLDEEGMILTPEVVSVNHPYGWKSYAVEIEGDGVHSFFGLSYNELKL